MYQEERICQILEVLKERKTLSNQEITELFHISRDTARRDIVRLVEQGAVVRTHGGIMVPPMYAEAMPYKERSGVNREEKKLLAQKAVTYLTPGSVCFFDIATTVEEICRHVPDTIEAYTNSLDNMEYLAERGCGLHMLGGRMNRRNRYFYGGETLFHMENIHFDIAFIGAASICCDGIYVEEEEDAWVKRKAAERSAFVCVVSDSSKFLKKSHFKAVSFESIHLLLTDSQPPAEIMKSLKETGTILDLVNG